MKKIVLITLLTCKFFMSNSQEIISKKGNINLPSSDQEMVDLAKKEKGTYKYSVSDYFRHPEQSAFKFSPNGRYISYSEKSSNNKSHVYVKNTETNEIRRVIEEKNELIRGYGWITDSILIYVQDKGGDENYHIFSINIDGTNAKELTPFDGVKVDILLTKIENEPNSLIVSMNKENPSISEPYKINIKTGELKKLFTNADIENPITSYCFDKNGFLKVYFKIENETDNILYYRESETKPFVKTLITTWKQTFNIIDFNYSTSNPNDAYIATNLESNTTEIVLYDFKEKKIVEKLFANPYFDVEELGISKLRNYELDYYSFEGEKVELIPISETYKKLIAKFNNYFPNKEVTITDYTEDETKYLLYISSDKLYGKYFFYDAKKDQFKEIINLFPQLHEEDMAEMKPIQFMSRDGILVHGYLTIPKNASKNQKVALIVNPHGGPYGVRDSWGFNPETQLFASRGYATLQVNYRGSGGYGKAFSSAGNKQIGRNMLNDLEDGVAFVKTMDFIDPQKVAIYGGSYGGLATLGSLVKTPDLFKCGVDYVGVSNLFTFFNSIPEYWKPYIAQIHEQWYDPNNKTENDIMKAVSPALNVDKIKKPLFVIQGANDPRVNIDESDQIVTNLRKRGFYVPYLVKYNEGHGFSHEENQIQLYESMLGFFACYLK